MRRVGIVIGLLALAACCAAFAHGGAQASSFRLPDAGAACKLAGERLVCANLQVRSGLSLPGRGTPRAVPAQVWWDASTPVLEHWQHGTLTCRAAGASILCRNASGASISIDGTHIAVAL
jgi:hypothetical protein